MAFLYKKFERVGHATDLGELAMRVMAEAAKLRRGEPAQNFDLNALLEQLRAAIAGSSGQARQ
jgi:hypothetical protein